MKDLSSKSLWNLMKNLVIYTSLIISLLLISMKKITSRIPLLILINKRDLDCCIKFFVFCLFKAGLSLRKVNRHVDFPLMLDLAPFCSATCKV